MKKHLEKSATLSKLFHKNNLKTSYCCMDNSHKIVSQHNLKTSNEKDSNQIQLKGKRSPIER